MGIQRYSIIYSSKTGNTKKLAEKIREVLPEENCDYFGTEGVKAFSSDILYIGFWTDIGNADGRIYVSGENAPVSQGQIRKDEREAGSCTKPG